MRWIILKHIIGDQGIDLQLSNYDEAAILDLRDFQTKIKEHLGEYKRNILKISEDGIFNYKGKELSYEHILPEDKNELNIIEKYRTDFFQSDYNKYKFT